MIREITIYGGLEVITKEDYLKVVEENNYLKRQDKERETTINNYEKSSKEKEKEIERLKNLYEPKKQYEDWCELKYWYNDIKTNETKMYRQHMDYEEACELIGMDSDNWFEFNVVKYKKEVE